MEDRFRRTTSIIDLFETQVRRSADSIAVIDDIDCWTYHQLNRRANEIAYALREVGARSEALVPICMERSVELIAALLGILKSGAAYVPIDPSFPTERVSRILSDCDPAVVVTQEKLLEKVGHSSRRVFCTETRAHHGEGTENPDTNITAQDLAYLIYTSGSTGRPKGVEIMHSSLAALVTALIDKWQLTPEERFLASASVSFDMSISEIFVALAAGASVKIVDSPFAQCEKFLKAFHDPEITFVTGTSSTWRMILESGWPGNKKMTAVCGGEALSLELAVAIADKVKKLWNMYGPTETCVWSTASLIHRDDTVVTIGQPLAGTRIYVLDPQDKQVRPGSKGELCIAGTGLARGYRGDSFLTSTRFVPNPFSDSSSDRLYRTGDLVRVRENGEIEFTGRIDHQIKVRGVRIEPGDVEAALRRHPAIQDTAVAARQDASGNNTLIAYLVAKGTVPPSVRELQLHLTEILPQYMIPSLFIFLESLPVTPNGKLDRNALLNVVGPTTQPEGVSIQPSGLIEQTLATIWARILGVPLPGTKDNFLELGGHSLSAMQVLARIREAFQVELPISAIFQSPTISDLSQHVAKAISEERRVLPIIRKTNRQQDIPLSFQQEGVWFLQKLNPQFRAYHFQSRIQFDGDLDPGLLIRSLAEIIRRHEIYRTSFPSSLGRPVQQIHDPWIPEVPIIDLSGEADPETAVDEFIHKIVTEIQFDIERLPLNRWFLFALSGKKNVLLHVEHHLIHDGWSFRLFLQELITLYSAFSKGLPCPLPDPEIQFADYAWWQKNVLWNLLKQDQLPYWERVLWGAQHVMELPSDHSRPKLQTDRGAAPRMDLPPKLHRSLIQLAKENSTTLFVTMLSALQVLIYRYSAQEDLALGTTMANRRARETEDMMGMIVNTVVLRTKVAGDLSFRELLSRSRQTVLEAQEHQDVPFRVIVESLHPERQLQANPLFQVMFNFHDARLRLPEIPGIEVTVTEILSNDSAKFDLNLIVIPPVEKIKGRESITLIWEYSSDLFRPDTILRMMNHYLQILEGTIADADCKISDLPLLTQAEQQQILVDWNQTTVPFPREQTISELFEQQAQQNPEFIAVRDAAQALTYTELNRKANQVARYLKRFDIGPETTVGIMMPRSVEMVIGMLAILKSGGAYVPLDINDPGSRSLRILGDANPKAILTMKVEEGLIAEQNHRFIRMDADWNRIAEENDRNLHPVSNGESLAYVIYTSGTTGQPKGVAITHRGITRLVYGIQCIPITNADVVLQTAPVCFDVSAFEIWGSLLNGAQLVLPEELLSLEQLGQRIRDDRVTWLWLASALFGRMVSHNIEGLKTVKTLITGGDVVSRFAAQEARGQLNSTRIFNGYGPTEAAMFSTFYEILETTPFEKNIPIGRPAQNTQIYILDERMHPVPVGVEGEIYIARDGLAREYYKDPVLTSKKFVQVPFAGRCYKTGDAARWMVDGNIDFLGRKDRQLKIRGFRIEPEEVETALLRHPAVAEAAVVPFQESCGDQKLAAYIVPRNGESPTIYQLRTFLSDTLPSYMVPAFYVFLDGLPVTNNGKFDRDALPPYDSKRPDLSSPYLEPRNELEKVIARIWAQVLDRDRIGILDDFFELGGESLAAIQVVSHIYDAVGLHIPVRLIFENPTVSGLAESVQNHPQRKEPLV